MQFASNVPASVKFEEQVRYGMFHAVWCRFSALCSTKMKRLGSKKVKQNTGNPRRVAAGLGVETYAEDASVLATGM